MRDEVARAGEEAVPPRAALRAMARRPVTSPMPDRRSAAFVLAVALAYAGGVVAYLPLLSLLLPIKIDTVAGDARIDVLTASVIAGALAASIANIAFGALSDRAVARGRGRRRWLAGGVVATAASYAGIAAAASPVAVVLAVIAFQVAVNALLAPLLAIVAEEVPDAQKGVTGGLLALGPPAGSLVGAVLIGMAGLGEEMRLAIVPLVGAICILPLLLLGRTATAAVPAAGVAIPRRDLLVASVARSLVQVAGTVLSLYLLYYFASIVPDAPASELGGWVGGLLFVAYLLPVPVAVAAGRLADRVGRHKPILLAAALLAAAGLTGLALADGRTAGAAAFVVYAIGSSVFLALHAGFAMQLLPDPRHRGRDLGLLNLTNTLPALAGPLLAWSLATPRDFSAVMLVLAALTLTGGVAMLAVRGRA